MKLQAQTYSNRITSRERIFNALQAKPVDHIPFTPLIDWYTIMDMPTELVNEAHARGYNRGILYISRHIGIDIVLRHVLVYQRYTTETPFLCSLGCFKEPIRTRAEVKGSVIHEVLETPVGTLSGTYGFTDRVGLIPHPIEHFVNDLDELNIFHYAIEHLSEQLPEQTFEHFLAIEEELGEDGIATTSISKSPLMYLLEMVWGLENTYYLLQDNRKMVEAILERLHLSQKGLVEALAESPAQVIIQYEDTSSTLLSRKIFRKYCLPYLNVYADILKSAGKIYLVHACGKLHNIVEDLSKGYFSGICDIAPPPTGDLPLDVAADKLRGKVVMGGVDPTMFVDGSEERVKNEITGLIERLKPHRGVLLGSADTAPRGTTIERFRMIQQLSNTLGTYL